MDCRLMPRLRQAENPEEMQRLEVLRFAFDDLAAAPGGLVMVAVPVMVGGSLDRVGPRQSPAPGCAAIPHPLKQPDRITAAWRG
jgi:hypothetical protein